MIHDLCLTAARRALIGVPSSIQWIYYEASTNKPIEYDTVIREQLESCHTKNLKGLVRRSKFFVFAYR